MTDIIDFHSYKKQKEKKEEKFNENMLWKPLPIKNVDFEKDFIIVRVSSSENGVWEANYNVVSDRKLIEELNCSRNGLMVQWITMREIESLIQTFEKPIIG